MIGAGLVGSACALVLAALVALCWLGPLLTRTLVERIGVGNLLLVLLDRDLRAQEVIGG